VALILKMMAQRGESLTEILETYPRYYSERIALNCSLDQSIKIKNKIESYYQAKGYKIQKTGRLGGGLKIFFDHNSFLWLRRSKTEADVLRLIADGDDIGKVQGILEEGQKLFKKFAK
jgi:phosphomannomutase